MWNAERTPTRHRRVLQALGLVLLGVLGLAWACTPEPESLPGPAFALTPISYGELRVEPAEAAAGFPVRVAVRATNPAAAPQPYAADLRVDGELVDQMTGELQAGASRLLLFTVARAAAGAYRVEIGGLTGAFQVGGAQIALRELQVTPRTVGRPGDPVTVSATALNEGSAVGEYAFDLLVDGAREGTVQGSLLPGERASVALSVVRRDPGTYLVRMGSLQESFTVAPRVRVALSSTLALSAEGSGVAVDATGRPVTISVVPGLPARISAAGVVLPINVPAGGVLRTFQDPLSGAVLEDNRWSIPLRDEEGAVRIDLVVETEDLVGTGTEARGGVRSITLQGLPLEFDARGLRPEIGLAVASMTARLNDLPAAATVTMATKDALPASTQTGIELLAGATGETIVDLGTALWIKPEGLPNGPAGVDEARVCLGVSQAWTERHQGDAIRMAHSTPGPDGGEVHALLTATREPSLDPQGRVRYCARTEGLSFFALLAVRAIPADLLVEKLTVEPAVVQPGQPVRVRAELRNAGGQTAARSLALLLDGGPLSAQTAEAQPGETVVADFLLRPTAAGRHVVGLGDLETSFVVRRALAAAEVQLRDLVVEPGVVRPGEPVRVRLTARNTSSEQGSYLVPLTVNGALAAQEPVDLPPGELVSLHFDVVREEPATYAVAVGDLEGSFAVQGEPRLATLVVRDLLVEPPAARVGRPVALVAVVENIGDLASTFQGVVEVVSPSGALLRTPVNGTVDKLTRLPLRSPDVSGFAEAGTYQARLGDVSASFRVEPGPGRGPGRYLLMAGAIATGLAAVALLGVLARRARRA